MIQSIDSFDNNNPQIANNNGVNFFFVLLIILLMGFGNLVKITNKKNYIPQFDHIVYNRESIKYIYFLVCLSSGWLLVGWVQGGYY